ncbi:hypothetical protein LINPERHAP1_LOCUS31507 [Linum perenne]
MQEDSEANHRCPKVVFSESELKSFYRPWSKSLVVKVLERSFSFGAVKRRLESLWAKNGSIQVTDAANSFFLVRFADHDDYKRAAFGGPWKIYDFYFSAARWTPEFNEEAPLKTILTWVRLPRLPIHYFNHLAVTRIGNYIGKTVRIDLATTEGARARYARVCVEVDVSKPLLGKYMIEDRTFLVEYESLENICASCGFYGHKHDSCLTLSTISSPTPQKKSDEHVGCAGDVGDWMVVQRRNKNKNRKENKESSKSVQSGSRFDILPNEADTPPQTCSEEVAVIGVKEKEVDPITADLAASLAATLGNAHQLQTVPGTSSGKGKSKSAPGLPLVDITNGGKKKNLVADGPNDDMTGKVKAIGLVDVPVMFSNPTFQGSVKVATTPKVKKQVPQRDKVSAIRVRPARVEKGGPKDGKQVRSFTSRPGPSKENSSAGGAVKAGEPPDRS